MNIKLSELKNRYNTEIDNMIKDLGDIEISGEVLLEVTKVYLEDNTEKYIFNERLTSLINKE
jgi:N-acetylneuraminic acid mutarotase